MKRRNLLIAVVLALVSIVAAFLAINSRRAQPEAVLPHPNAYDDFAAATSWLVRWNGDLFALSPEQLQNVVEQNSKALETVHSGLSKQSAVPVQNDMNWFNRHMVQVGAHKSLAQLLVAEGLIHLDKGRTNEAADSFANCIAFAHAAHRGGLMIDELVGIACQAIGAKHLLRLGPSVSPDELREIIKRLAALDQTREPASAILQRDREWSRGAYGLSRSTFARVAAHKTLRDAEASFEKKHARSVASLRLVMTELAVRGYAAKNGKLPSSLSELVPAWLPSVPIDPLGNAPLVYRVTTNSFLLFGIGPDGKVLPTTF